VGTAGKESECIRQFVHILIGKDNMDFSSKDFSFIVKELIKLSVQMDTSELENYKAFIDSIKPSGDELLETIKEEEYKRLEKQRIQEAVLELAKDTHRNIQIMEETIGSFKV
jgi:hypothetical protein